MLKKPYFTPFSLNSETNCRENPHCGADGVPFMKSITGAAFTRFESRMCNSSVDCVVDPEEYAGAVAGSDDFGAYEDRSFVVVGGEPFVPSRGVAVNGGGMPALPLLPACRSMAARTLAASLPDTVSRFLPSRTSTRKGTAVTS